MSEKSLMLVEEKLAGVIFDSSHSDLEITESRLLMVHFLIHLL